MGVGLLDRDRTVAPKGYARWLIPPAALAVHLSIGQVYAFSVFKEPLVEHFDTNLTPIGWIFSIAIVMLGLSAAFGGTWVERSGPRKAMFVAACCWGPGFLVAALGVATDQLWLVYLGYGVIGGIGLGIGYISPVSTLIKWFPDRPGMATGLAIMGFGGGALIAAPLSNWLLDTFGDLARGCDRARRSSRSAIIYFVVMTARRVHRPAPRRRAGSPRAGTPEAQAEQRMVTHGERHGGQRDPDAAVLAAVGRAVLQRDRRHRHPRAGLADDPGPLRHGQRGGGRRLRRPALALQHERALRLVLDVGRDRAQARSTCATSGSAPSCTSCWPRRARPRCCGSSCSPA